ncbi:uncharacterized protein [Clytia hemisphaerica]|uniref:uncharacterized protein n=1 Tax=Clytia hemisphaerica TaxID=252671 RepID=UPI0034D4F8BD
MACIEGRVLGLTSFRANLVVEFVVVEKTNSSRSNESSILIDFQDSNCIKERPSRTHSFFKIHTTRETFEDLVIPNFNVWRDVRKSQKNVEEKCNQTQIQQRFWTHFCGDTRSESDITSITQTKRDVNFTSNSILNETTNHKCLTVVRQIMVPTMTISSILLGIWVRYGLKHYAKDALL